MRGYCNFNPRFLLTSLVVSAFLCAPSFAGPARCFLHGIITPRLENKEKTSLSDMIRLHFDVSLPEHKSKCETLMESYCTHNVKGKEYSPSRLKGSFKPDVDKSEETTYKFSESCVLETD